MISINEKNNQKKILNRKKNLSEKSVFANLEKSNSVIPPKKTSSGILNM